MQSPESPSPVERLRQLVKGKPFLSAREIVELGLVKSESTLSHWRDEKSGPSYVRVSPGRHLYPVEELLAWFQSCYFPQNTASQSKNTDPQSTLEASSEKAGAV